MKHSTSVPHVLHKLYCSLFAYGNTHYWHFLLVFLFYDIKILLQSHIILLKHGYQLCMCKVFQFLSLFKKRLNSMVGKHSNYFSVCMQPLNMLFLHCWICSCVNTISIILSFLQLVSYKDQCCRQNSRIRLYL